MNKFNEDFKYLILLYLLAAVAITVTYAHYGNILVDCGREIYYPVQILKGKILYKDLFNIYGPFAYLFNAALFKIFGINLNVLYASGMVCALAIVSLIYLISAKFLPKFLSFSIAAFTIAVGILNTTLFNFIFPYSYSILYGLVAILFSVFLFIKYQQQPRKNTLLYLSCFFAGLSVTNKYEFVPYILALLFFVIKTKKYSLKDWYYIIFSLIFAPVFCFGIMFLQGMHISDLTQTLFFINKMAHSQTLKYYYIGKGVYFNIKIIPLMILRFIFTLITAAVIYYGCKIKNKIVSNLTILFGAFITIFCVKPDLFIFVPPLILILSLINIKKIIKNAPLLFLIIVNLLISLKVFWGMVILSYGVFFISLNLITLLAIINHSYAEKNINYKAFALYILIISIILSCGNYIGGRYRAYELKTKYGNIYLDKDTYTSTQNLIDYLNKNTKPTDKVVIYPEGTFINFLTARDGENYYSSMIPLYFEVINEDALIKHFKKTKPQYVVFNNLDMSQDYYFKNICNDYAYKFCGYVSANYTQEKIIDGKLRFLIFKIK